MDGSLNRVTLPTLGRLELPMQLCRNSEIPCLGSTLFFLMAYYPNRGPRGRRPHLCVLLIRSSSVQKWVRVGQGLIAKLLPKCCLLVLMRALLECNRAMWLYPWPVGAPGQCDSASLAVAVAVAVGPPPPRFCCRYNTIFPFLTMADIRASPSLPPMNVAAGWCNRDIRTKKWQCPCGKVLPILQNPESKAFSIHCSGTQHTD